MALPPKVESVTQTAYEHLREAGLLLEAISFDVGNYSQLRKALESLDDTKYNLDLFLDSDHSSEPVETLQWSEFYQDNDEDLWG